MLIADAIGWYFLGTMVVIACLCAALVNAAGRPSILPKGRRGARASLPPASRPRFAPPAA